MIEQDAQILSMIGDMKGELGEVRGQLRELIHNMNNVSLKLDAVAGATAKNENLHQEVAELKARNAVLEARIIALETVEHKRDGAMSLGAILLKSPIVGWVVGAVVALWVLFKERIV